MYGLSEALNPTTQSVFDSQESIYGIISTRETWYTVKDGNWNDPTIWRTIRGRRKDFPLSSATVSMDDVYIKHNITMNTSAVFVNNLYISGSLTFSGGFNFNIFGNIQCSGTLATGSQTCNILLYGNNNFITTYSGTAATFTYARNGDQNIIPLAYFNLTTATSSIRCTKRVTTDLVVAGALTMNASTSNGVVIMECGSYNLSVTGGSTINANTILSKVGAGTVLFTGLLIFNASTNGGLDFSVGNPNVEFRAGVLFSNFITTIIWSTGTGTWSFTTNNQALTNSSSVANLTWDCSILISGTITLTVANVVSQPYLFNAPINGDNAASKLVNTGLINFASAAAMPSMTTGITDFTTNVNTVTYSMTTGATIMPVDYNILTTSGAGVKSYAGGTINGTYVGSGSGGFTMNGNIIFVGGINYTATLAFATGANTVEFRGGFLFNTAGGTTGSSVYTLTTNAQNITATQAIAQDILISGAITATTPAAAVFTTTGKVDGDNAGSTWDNRGTVNYKSATAPMVTGVLKCNAAVNTFLYSLGGNQNVQGGTTHLTTAQYWHLTLSVSGTKTLQGNVSVLNTYTLSGTATKNNNGFTFGNP